MTSIVRCCFAGLCLVISFTASAANWCAAPWPLWEKFAEVHIQPDGRVVDFFANKTTTSEGQSYALFFALVAGDKVRFNRILKWTHANLAQGDLALHLPAWQWGQRKDGSWGVLDSNSASDADLWIAYSLLHAAKLWNNINYRVTANALLREIQKREVVKLPSIGKMLLPAPVGFALKDKVWRLNPSYSPIQVLRYFSKVDKSAGWDEVLENSFRMLAATSHAGISPDWVLYRASQGFTLDPEQGKVSGYDSIRVYLWWAMLNPQEPYFEKLKPYITGAKQFAVDAPLPERVNIADGQVSGSAPVGFVAAFAPYQKTLYKHMLATESTLEDDVGYYNYVLSLFGTGWMEDRYRFNADGSLNVKYKKCTTSTQSKKNKPR
jgi:endoglucanase